MLAKSIEGGLRAKSTFSAHEASRTVLDMTSGKGIVHTAPRNDRLLSGHSTRFRVTIAVIR